MVKCENLCRCFASLLKIIRFKVNGLKILKVILGKLHSTEFSIKISNDHLHFLPSVMQCFPCLGSSSQDDLTHGGSRNSSYKAVSHLLSKREEIIVRSQNRLGNEHSNPPPPPLPSNKEPHTTSLSNSTLSLSSRTKSRRNCFWRALKLLCICSRRKNSCTQLPSWGIRRDCFGRVPVAMDTPTTNRINSMYNMHMDDQICYDADGEVPCGEPCDQNPGYDGGDDRLQDPSNFCSMETGGGSSHGRGETPWCKLLYWEESEIRSRVFNVWDPAINVLGDTPHGSGWSLSTFFNTPAKNEKISRVRAKICQGLILWREGKAVWVYNRSKTPVYLNSASLDGTFFNLNLYKCPPGYAMIIYYYEMARTLMGRADYKSRKKCDTTDVNSVRISFAKGWGKDYHRTQILCCPCWIEVHVVPTLKIEQRVPHR